MTDTSILTLRNHHEILHHDSWRVCDTNRCLNNYGSSSPFIHFLHSVLSVIGLSTQMFISSHTGNPIFLRMRKSRSAGRQKLLTSAQKLSTECRVVHAGTNRSREENVSGTNWNLLIILTSRACRGDKTRSAPPQTPPPIFFPSLLFLFFRQSPYLIVQVSL